MRRAALAVLICISIHVESLYAACKSEACKRAVAWKNGYTAIVLEDDVTRSDYFAVLDAVQDNKGVVAIEAERVLLGWIPAPAAGRIRATRGVRAVLYDAVARPGDLVRNENALSALSFFNRLLTGEYEDGVEAGLAITGAPLTGCVVQRAGSASSAQLRRVPDESDADAPERDDIGARARWDWANRADAQQQPGGISSTFWGQMPYQNPDMRGRVSVQLFRLDSDGTVDPNLHTWTTTDFRYARDQVYGAFNFWVNEATQRNVPLSFRVEISDPFSRYTRNYLPTRTRYEPITHGISDDYLWVNDALAMHGYGASPVIPENVYERNEAFNRDKAADPVYGPFDRSFTVYIIYNPPPAPAVFADRYRAYAMYDGPFTMMMWNSGGWGPQNLGLVLTHETAHIFWACDEYYDPGTNTGCFTCDHCLTYGPRNQIATPHIRNPNCRHPRATGCDSPRAVCIMDDLAHGLCSHTPAQIGW